MPDLKYFFRYGKHLLNSGNEHSIHSPFIFDLYNTVFRSKSRYYIFKTIEQRRRALLRSPEKIKCTDFGAGSKFSAKSERSLKEITASAAKAPKLAQALFRLTEYLKPKNIFDLGTSTGLTTAYLASADSSARVTSFEGCQEVAAVAEMNFKELGIKNISLVVGNLDNTLAKEVANVPSLDLVFFDANHRSAPTLSYFEQCLPKAGNNSVFVFDDIHWTEDMEEAWEKIKSHPQVKQSVDLFHYGLVFFRKEQEEQDFVLRF